MEVQFPAYSRKFKCRFNLLEKRQSLWCQWTWKSYSSRKQESLSGSTERIATHHSPRRISVVAHYTIWKTPMVCPNTHCPSILLTFFNQWSKNLERHSWRKGNLFRVDISTEIEVKYKIWGAEYLTLISCIFTGTVQGMTTKFADEGKFEDTPVWQIKRLGFFFFFFFCPLNIKEFYAFMKLWFCHNLLVAGLTGELEDIIGTNYWIVNDKCQRLRKIFTGFNRNL